MTVQALDKICNYYGISKVTYLASATLFTAGLIIECILLYLVVIPYLSEQKYINTTCHYTEGSKIGKMILKKCENKCTKETSFFYCLFIKVSYKKIHSKQLTIGYLFDNLRTFSKHKVDKCSTMPCLGLLEDNRRWAMAFNESLYRRTYFQCFYKDDETTNVLLYKLQSPTIVMNCIVWPCTLLTLGLISLFLTWYCAGCKIWSQDKTVIA